MELKWKILLLLGLCMLLNQRANAQNELLRDGRYVGEYETINYLEEIDVPFKEFLCFYSDSTFELQGEYDLNAGKFLRHGDTIQFQLDEFETYIGLVKKKSISMQLTFLNMNLDFADFIDTVHCEFKFEKGKTCKMDGLEGSESIDEYIDDNLEMSSIGPYMSTFEEDNDPVIKKQLKADLILWGYGGGDGMRLVRHKKTKKWGIYQVLGEEADEFIPMNYDSLRSFEQNANFTAVYNNGHVGFYLAKWSYGDQANESVPCVYDDYVVYESPSWPPKYFLAVKKNDKWAWLDWFNNVLKTEFNYDTPGDLPPIDYEQQMYDDE